MFLDRAEDAFGDLSFSELTEGSDLVEVLANLAEAADAVVRDPGADHGRRLAGLCVRLQVMAWAGAQGEETRRLLGGGAEGYEPAQAVALSDFARVVSAAVGRRRLDQLERLSPERRNLIGALFPGLGLRPEQLGPSAPELESAPPEPWVLEVSGRNWALARGGESRQLLRDRRESSGKASSPFKLVWGKDVTQQSRWFAAVAEGSLPPPVKDWRTLAGAITEASGGEVVIDRLGGTVRVSQGALRLGDRARQMLADLASNSRPA